MDDKSFFSLFAQKEAKRFKLKVGVFLFLLQEDKILLLRRFNTGIEDGLHVVPMGGHDGKESLTATVIREAKEETNIELRAEDLTVCHLMHRFHPMPDGLSFEQMDVYFRAEAFCGEIKNLEKDKCDELAFYSLTALPEKTSPFIRQAIRCLQRGEFYSEFGWENLLANQK